MSLSRLALGSALVLAALGFALFRESEPVSAEKPLIVYCAAALKPAMQATAAKYDRPVEFRFGNSEQILAQASIGNDGDLFLPADDSFVRTAQASGVAVEVFPLAKMRAVVLVPPGNPRHIATLDDLLKKDLRFGQANPDAAAIGRVTRDHLLKSGRWNALHANTLVYHTTVTDAANAVKLGSNDAAIVWDAVATNYPSLTVVKVPELQGVIGRVELAVLRSCTDPAAARRFLDFVKSAPGREAFRAAGFTDLAP
jgi:molybdate transport system substrate-binding protein